MAGQYLTATTLLIFLALFLQCYAQCPEGYNSMAGMCILMGQRVPWDKAQAACVKENATLISTKVKDNWDQASANIPAAQLTGVWFGLHYDKASDKWSWSDGSPYDPTKDWAPWGTDQPNTKQGECVVIKIDTKKENKPFWFMGSCLQALTGVCVKPQQTTIGTGTPFTMPSFPNVTCPPGLMAFAGNCMKYSQDPQTYDDAMAACIANNSYILFTKDPVIWGYAEYAIGSQLTNFWIGLAYDTTSKQFKYSNGEIYNADTDWAPWAKDNPGTPGAWAGNCVGVQQDYVTSKYQWIMVDCSSGLNGVCLYNMPTTSTKPGTTPTTTTTAVPTTTTTTPAAAAPSAANIPAAAAPTTANSAAQQAAAAPAAAVTAAPIPPSPPPTLQGAGPQSTVGVTPAAYPPPAPPSKAGAVLSTAGAAPAVASSAAPPAASAQSTSGAGAAPVSSKTANVAPAAAASSAGTAGASATVTPTPMAAGASIITGSNASPSKSPIDSSRAVSAAAATNSNSTPVPSAAAASPQAANGSSVSAAISQFTSGSNVNASVAASTAAPKATVVPSAASVSIVGTPATSSANGSVTTGGAGGTTGSAAATAASVALANSSTTAPACYRVGRFLPAPENGRMAYLPFDKTNTTDSNGCGRACLSRNTCVSFDYNKSSQQCFLFAHAFADDCMQFIKDTNFQHFDLISSDVV